MGQQEQTLIESSVSQGQWFANKIHGGLKASEETQVLCAG